jgi:endonuclease III
MPALPVDTHVHRVSTRLGLVGEKASPEETQIVLEKIVPPEDVYSFHLNLIAHGRQVCKAQRPRHEACVLNELCDYYAREKADQGG